MDVQSILEATAAAQPSEPSFKQSPREKERQRNLVFEAHQAASSVHGATVDVTASVATKPTAGKQRASVLINEEVLSLLVHVSQELNAAQAKNVAPEVEDTSKGAQKWGFFTQMCRVRDASDDGGGAPIDISAIAEREPLVESDDEGLGSNRVGLAYSKTATAVDPLPPVETQEPHMKEDWREKARLRRLLKEQEAAEKRKQLEAAAERRRQEILLAKQNAAARMIQNAWRVYKARSREDMYRFIILASDEHRASEARLKKLIKMEAELAAQAKRDAEARKAREAAAAAKLQAVSALAEAPLLHHKVAAGPFARRRSRRVKVTPPVDANGACDAQQEEGGTASSAASEAAESSGPEGSTRSFAEATDELYCGGGSDGEDRPFRPPRDFCVPSSPRPSREVSSSSRCHGDEPLAPAADSGDSAAPAPSFASRSKRHASFKLPTSLSVDDLDDDGEGGEGDEGARGGEAGGTSVRLRAPRSASTAGSRMAAASPSVKQSPSVKLGRFHFGLSSPCSFKSTLALHSMPSHGRLHVQLSAAALADIASAGAEAAATSLSTSRSFGHPAHRQSHHPHRQVTLPTNVFNAAAAAAMEVFQTHGDAAAELAAADVLTSAGSEEQSAAAAAAVICDAIAGAVEQAVLDGEGGDHADVASSLLDSPIALASAELDGEATRHQSMPENVVAVSSAEHDEPLRSSHIHAAPRPPRAVADSSLSGWQHGAGSPYPPGSCPSSPMRARRRGSVDMGRYQEQGASKRDKAVASSPWSNGMLAADESYELTAHGWAPRDKAAEVDELLRPAHHASAPRPMTLEYQQSWLTNRLSYQGPRLAPSRPPSPVDLRAMLEASRIEVPGEALARTDVNGLGPVVVGLVSALANSVEVGGTWCTPLQPNNGWAPKPPPIGFRSANPRLSTPGVGVGGARNSAALAALTAAQNQHRLSGRLALTRQAGQYGPSATPLARALSPGPTRGTGSAAAASSGGGSGGGPGGGGGGAPPPPASSQPPPPAYVVLSGASLGPAFSCKPLEVRSFAAQHVPPPHAEDLGSEPPPPASAPQRRSHRGSLPSGGNMMMHSSMELPPRTRRDSAVMYDGAKPLTAPPTPTGLSGGASSGPSASDAAQHHFAFSGGGASDLSLGGASGSLHLHSYSGGDSSGAIHRGKSLPPNRRFSQCQLVDEDEVSSLSAGSSRQQQQQQFNNRLGFEALANSLELEPRSSSGTGGSLAFLQYQPLAPPDALRHGEASYHDLPPQTAPAGRHRPLLPRASHQGGSLMEVTSATGRGHRASWMGGVASPDTLAGPTFTPLGIVAAKPMPSVAMPLAPSSAQASGRNGNYRTNRRASGGNYRGSVDLNRPAGVPAALPRLAVGQGH